MIASLILLPVGLILVWLYWLCLPIDTNRGGRWRWTDSVLLLVLVCLSGIFIYTAQHADYANASPIWTEVVAAAGGYIVFTIGLTIGLILRRQSARGNQARQREKTTT